MGLNSTMLIRLRFMGRNLLGGQMPIRQMILFGRMQRIVL